MVCGLLPVAGGNKHFIDLASFISVGHIRRLFFTKKKYFIAFNFTRALSQNKYVKVQQGREDALQLLLTPRGSLELTQQMYTNHIRLPVSLLNYCSKKEHKYKLAVMLMSRKHSSTHLRQRTTILQLPENI